MALAVVSLVLGAALSLRFNVLILVAMIGGVMLSAAIVGITRGDGIDSVALTTLVLGTALQVGYLIGIVARVGAGWVRCKLCKLSASSGRRTKTATLA